MWAKVSAISIATACLLIRSPATIAAAEAVSTTQGSHYL